MRLNSAIVALLCLTGCPPKDDPVPDAKAQADGLYLAGTAAYMKGEFKEAHDRYAEVKKLNPTDPRLPAAEGEVYLAEVKLDEALKCFEDAAPSPSRSASVTRSFCFSR